MTSTGFIVRVARTAGTALLLAGCLLGPAFAYDSEKLEAALESLSAATFREWEQRAQAGDPIAQNVVGMAYKYGRVTPQNPSLSLHWFLKAARQGDADAQFNLGRIYGKATGSVYGKRRAAPRDDVAAAHWYRSAAEQNYAPAQRNLAIMYADGSPSVPHDRAQAVYWMRRAAAAGDPAASGLADKLEDEQPASDKERFRNSDRMGATSPRPRSDFPSNAQRFPVTKDQRRCDVMGLRSYRSTGGHWFSCPEISFSEPKT